jgi:hypothetical protein
VSERDLPYKARPQCPSCGTVKGMFHYGGCETLKDQPKATPTRKDAQCQP